MIMQYCNVTVNLEHEIPDFWGKKLIMGNETYFCLNRALNHKIITDSGVVRIPKLFTNNRYMIQNLRYCT